MMTKGMCGILLVAMQYVFLESSKRIDEMEYKPYGPNMCRKRFEISADSFIYSAGELSCCRVPTESFNMAELKSLVYFNMTEQRISGDGSIVWLKGNMMRTSGTSAPGINLCTTNSNGTSPPDISPTNNFTLGCLKLFRTKILYRACSKGNLCLVQYILANRLAHINSKNAFGTPVMVALKNRKFSVFHFLIAEGADLKAVDQRNNTILHLASKVGETSIVRKLLTHKCDVESRNKKGWTPMMWAVFYDQKRIVELLFSAGCNKTAVNDNMNNILHLACNVGNEDMVEYILSQHIIDIDSKGMEGKTPVMMAVEKGHTKIFDLLVHFNCSLKAADDNKDSVIHRACVNGKLDIVQRILIHDPALSEIKGHCGRTPLLLTALVGHEEMFYFLIQRNSNLRAVDDYLNNVLHLASAGGHKNIVKFILTLGFEVGSMNCLHETPLKIAMSRGHREIVKLLKS